MNENELLQLLYTNMRTAFSIEKKVSRNSLLQEFLELKSNKRFKIVLDSCQKIPSKYLFEIDNLLEKGYVRKMNNDEDIVLTALGIWKYEVDNGYNIESLISFIDDKYINVSSNEEQKLTDKEKVIIFTLVSLRAFSIESALDLKKGNYALDSIKLCLEKSAEKLYETNIIKSKMTGEKLFGKLGNEHPVSNLIRHTDALPKKTKMLYSIPENQKYYLNIASDGGVDIAKFDFALSILFKDHELTLRDLKDINSHCTDLMYEYSPFIFENGSNLFVNPHLDETIELCFRRFALKQ